MFLNHDKGTATNSHEDKERIIQYYHYTYYRESVLQAKTKQIKIVVAADDDEEEEEHTGRSFIPLHSPIGSKDDTAAAAVSAAVAPRSFL